MYILLVFFLEQKLKSLNKPKKPRGAFVIYYASQMKNRGTTPITVREFICEFRYSEFPLFERKILFQSGLKIRQISFQNKAYFNIYFVSNLSSILENA